MPAQDGLGNGAVYVTIVNRGAGADALVKATADAAATVELAETVQEGVVMKMRPCRGSTCPAVAGWR
jgi:copper(I)-binding protein